MLRDLVVLVLSFVAGAVVIAIVQGVNMAVFPPPPGFDWADPAAVETMVATMPVGAYVGVELSYVLGCLACGLAIGLFARRRPMLMATIAGVLFTLAGFANIASIPMPVAFAVLTTVTYMPCVLFGTTLARSMRAAKT